MSRNNNNPIHPTRMNLVGKYIYFKSPAKLPGTTIKPYTLYRITEVITSTLVNMEVLECKLEGKELNAILTRNRCKFLRDYKTSWIVASSKTVARARARSILHKELKEQGLVKKTTIKFSGE